MWPLLRRGHLTQKLYVITISESGVGDIVWGDRNSGECTLTISDHLEWTDSEHLILLQEKLNSYLTYIESGEILGQYAMANENKIKINVVMLHEPSQEAIDFLRQASKVISEAGFGLTWEEFKNDTQQAHAVWQNSPLCAYFAANAKH